MVESSHKLKVLKHESLRHNHHALIIIVESEEICDNLISYLRAYDISPFIGYVPLHSSPMGQSLGYSASDLPITHEVSKKVIRLPFHNQLSLKLITTSTKS